MIIMIIIIIIIIIIIMILIIIMIMIIIIIIIFRHPMALSGSRDRTALLWDLNNGTALR